MNSCCVQFKYIYIIFACAAVEKEKKDYGIIKKMIEVWDEVWTVGKLFAQLLENCLAFAQLITTWCKSKKSKCFSINDKACLLFTYVNVRSSIFILNLSEGAESVLNIFLHKYLYLSKKWILLPPLFVSPFWKLQYGCSSNSHWTHHQLANSASDIFSFCSHN